LNGVLGLLACVREEIEGLRHAILKKDLITSEHKVEYASQFLAHIDECAQHQRVIMDNVLSLSRLKTKDLSEANTTFDPRRTLESAVNMFDGMVRMKHLRFQMDTEGVPSGAEGLVVADENRLKQILINLLSNSVKYSRERGCITVALRRFTKPLEDDADQGDVYVYLEGNVMDRGLGISEEEQTLLFAPFASLKRKRVLEYGGSGLGLRITKELVDLMHGTISVRSKIGEGSVFTFVVRCGLPKLGAVATRSANDGKLATNASQTAMQGSEAAETLIREAEERVHCEAALDSTSSMPSRRPRVLECEDNHINQMVLSRFLKQRNIEYAVASSGEKALRLYCESLAHTDGRQLPFDILFMVPSLEQPIAVGLRRLTHGASARVCQDIELPGMNGIEATMQIRKMEEECDSKRRVPVVCMSGYTRSEYKLMAFGVGMNDYISKPFSKDKVYQLIDHYVTQNSTTNTCT
jgi:CheY-like chemotaxis protein